MKSNLKLSLCILFIAALISCDSSKNTNEEGVVEINSLSKEEVSEGWKLLFDGKSTDGWHLYNKGKIPSAWIAMNGELYCKPDTFEVEHGDLVSDLTYENFDLKFDWKISEAGNSGVFINVQEDPECPTAWTTGPEYQLLDNLGIHEEYLHDSTQWAACLYGFKPNLNEVEARPAGTWNESRISQKDGKVTYWLNGVITAEQDFNSTEWSEMVSKSGFKTFPSFGKSTNGHIALQDWAKGVSFRNIKLKEL